MRKVLISLLLIGIVSIVYCSSSAVTAGPFGFVKDKLFKKDKKGSADLKGLIRDSKKFIGNLIAGTKNLVKAQEATFRAAGMHKEAERMAAISDEMDRDPESFGDADKMKVTFEEVDKSQEKLNQLDMEKDFIVEVAKKEVGKGVTCIGVAALYDGSAVKTASDLMSKLPDAVKSDLKNVKQWKNYLALAKLATTYVPKQISSLKNVGTNLKDYASKHDCPLPSKEEQDKAVAEGKPESSDDDL